MIIRKAKVKEARLVADLWIEFMKDHDAIVLKADKRMKPHIKKNKGAKKNFQEFIKKCIRSRNALVYVAEDKGNLVAYVLSTIKKNIPVFQIKELGYFADLYVKKKYRGQGISTKFRDLSIDWFKKRKIKYISIMVYPQNTFAHKIYKKWGMFDSHVELRGKI